MDRKALRTLWWWALAGLMTFLLTAIVFGSSDHPVGMALSFAPWCGIPIFLLTSFIARRSRRRVTGVDVIRIGAWTVFACAEGVREMAASYYLVYWPQYSAIWRNSAFAVEGASLLVIVVVSLLYPSQKVPGPGECPSCGYNLCGNETGRCPECGEAMPAHQAESTPCKGELCQPRAAPWGTITRQPPEPCKGELILGPLRAARLLGIRMDSSKG